jgi:hypothetical protein
VVTQSWVARPSLLWAAPPAALASVTMAAGGRAEPALALVAALSALARSLSRRRYAGRWMAGYCFAVLAFVAIQYISVYINDVFGPF